MPISIVWLSFSYSRIPIMKITNAWIMFLFDIMQMKWNVFDRRPHMKPFETWIGFFIDICERQYEFDFFFSFVFQCICFSFCVVLAHGAAITSCPEPLGEQVSVYAKTWSFRVKMILPSIHLVDVFFLSCNRPMLILTIVINFSFAQTEHWRTKRARTVCCSTERETSTIIATTIGLLIVEHGNLIVSALGD